MVLWHIAERFHDVSLGTSLAVVVQIQQLAVILNGDAVYFHFGMFALGLGIRGAQEDISAFEIPREKDVYVAAGTRVGTRVETGQAHPFQQDVGEPLGLCLGVYLLQHLFLVGIVVACPLGRECPAQCNVALRLQVVGKQFYGIVDDGHNTMLSGQPEQLLPVLLAERGEVCWPLVKRAPQQDKHLVG